MKGRLHILYPNKPREIRDYLGPPDSDVISRLVGGLIEFVPLFDHWVNEQGISTPCIVVGNQEGAILNLPFNFPASAYWHYILNSKGAKTQKISSLRGTIVIITGDDEFIEYIL